MTEEVAGTEWSAADAATSSSPSAAETRSAQSAGAMLRQAREEAGVDLASLATALKVSVKKLEALEDDRHDLLPDAVFTRGLAAGVCRVLRIDAAPVLAHLPRTGVPRLDFDDPGLNTPFHMPGDVAKTPFLDRLSRPMILAALAVLMGALVLILFPNKQQRAELGGIVAQTGAPAAEPAETPAAAAAVDPASSVAVADAPAQATDGGKAVEAPAREPAKAEPVKGDAGKPVEASKKNASQAVAIHPPAEEAGALPVRKRVSSTGIVVFRSSGPSWIEVTDANGTIQLSRQIDEGDTVGASGALPLSVTVGRADITKVEVRGQPFALESVSKNGVARFEVK